MDAAPNADALSPEESGETIEVVDPSRAEARIGRYQLCYHLASGGMASVFLARAVGPAGFWKPVALKRIHPHLARRKDFVAMFLDEARIAARIDHPNVCAVHDFGEADGTYYLAMEYLVGVPLIRLLHAMEREAKVGRSRFESTRWHALAARVIADAAAGLHAAHELSEGGEPLGVVHRDVSPQNVFVTFAGAVKVVDFGIALARDRVQETETGTLKGKLGYMAPEQAASGRLDRRADVWALGVCLWEMLVGARLFRRGTPMETLRAVADAPIEAPSSRRAGVPAELDRIVLRALSRDREGRQPTARALARELEAFVRATGEPTGLSDLAEWMDPLFTAERAHKSEIVHTVLHAADVSTAMRAKRSGEVVEGVVPEGRVGSDTASLPAPSPARGTVSLVAPAVHAAVTAALPAQRTAAPVAPSVGSVGVHEAVSAEVPARSQRRGLIAAGIVGVSAIAIAAMVAVQAEGPDEVVTLPDAPVESAPTAADPIEPAPVAAPVATPIADEPAVAPEAPPEEQRARPRARERAPRVASSVETRTGWVTVAATGGWADVYEGDRHLGQTPVRVQLRAGRRVLTVRPFGRDEPRRVSVTVAPDTTTPLVVPLR